MNDRDRTTLLSLREYCLAMVKPGTTRDDLLRFTRYASALGHVLGFPTVTTTTTPNPHQEVKGEPGGKHAERQ